MDHVRFDYLLSQAARWTSRHERFGIDHNRCILCTRCVRVCDEIEGRHTWDVAGRGANARVITDLNQPWGDVADLHVVRQVRAGLPDRRHLPPGLDRRRDGARPRRSSSSSSPPGRRSNGTSEVRDGLAGRLLRLPHVVPRPRRVADRPRRHGRPRLQPDRRRQGVSRRTWTSCWSKGRSPTRRTWR